LQQVTDSWEISRGISNATANHPYSKTQIAAAVNATMQDIANRANSAF